MSILFCRECSEGKHVNCDGTALDPETDELTSCTCPDPSHGRSAEKAAPVMRLQITEVDHDANAFWTLDDNVTHEAPAEAEFAALPEEACDRDAEGRATHEHRCYMADLLDAEGSIITDKEISEEIAQALLDEPIPVLRDRFRAMLWDVYGATG